MNKKALTMQKLIVYIILIITALLIIGVFFAPSGFLNRVAEKAKIFETFLPGQQEDELTSKTVVSEQAEKTFSSNLVESFKKYKGNKGPCIINYEGVGDIGNNHIELLSTSGGTLIKLIDQKGTELNREFIEELFPCAVAGEGAISDKRELWKPAYAFYNLFLEKNTLCQDCSPYTYKLCKNSDENSNNCEEVEKCSPVEDEDCIIKENTSCTIPCDTAYTYNDFDYLILEWEGTDYDEPSIKGSSILGFPLESDLEDGGMLYNADENHICFIPTFDGWLGCNPSEKGLDDACIPQIIRSNKLPYCTINAGSQP